MKKTKIKKIVFFVFVILLFSQNILFAQPNNEIKIFFKSEIFLNPIKIKTFLCQRVKGNFFIETHKKKVKEIMDNINTQMRFYLNKTFKNQEPFLLVFIEVKHINNNQHVFLYFYWRKTGNIIEQKTEEIILRDYRELEYIHEITATAILKKIQDLFPIKIQELDI